MESYDNAPAYDEDEANILGVLDLVKACDSWSKQINESEDGQSIVIDIAHEIRKIFARNIIHIAFGEDIEEEKFELHMRGDLQANTFIPKQVSMSEAIGETFD